MRPVYKWTQRLLNLLFRILFGLRIQGRGMIPPGPLILASNHISLVDPPVVAASIDRELYFLGKKELFDSRLLGAVIRSYNCIPVNRNRPDRAALRRIAEILRDGQAVLLFPEGTRGPGDKLLPGKPGVGKLAIEAQVPIVPAFISGSNHLRQTFLRTRRLSVSFGAPIEQSWIASLGHDKAAYRQLAQEVMSRIESLRRSSAGK